MFIVNNILTVFRKEFYRVISDKRLVFTAIFLPGLAIYLMYSFMGNAIGGTITDIQEHKMIIYTDNMPNDFKLYVYQNEINPDFYLLEDSDYDTVKEQILSGEVDMLIIFPEDFETQIDNYLDDGSTIPNVQTFYNPGEKYSLATYQTMNGLIGNYATMIGIDRFGDDYFGFTIDAPASEDHTIVDEDKAAGQEFAQLMPMLVIMFLFSGAMSIGPDSIAGEKERGTIATLLVTPIKRSELAIGKVLSLSIIALFSATSSFIGILFSLPKLMQGESLDYNIYGITDYLILLTVLLATVLVIVGIVSVVSAYAKTIKEASMLILPFYFISIIIGVSTMFSGEATSNLVLYLLPIYSSVNMIISILTFEINVAAFLITVLSSILYVSIFIYILNRLFQSEKVMFSK